MDKIILERSDTLSLKDIMLILQQNYIVGISIACVIVVALYLAFSIRLIVTSRREGINACASAMIPVYNLILWIRKWRRKKKNNIVLAEDEEIEI